MSVLTQYRIARNEFVLVLFHPLVAIVGLIAIALAFLNGDGDGSNFQAYIARVTIPQDVFFLEIKQTWTATFMVCSIMAAFLGAISIARERWNNSLDVLLTKPLYRRDFFFGKFSGQLIFILAFVSFVLLFNCLMVALFFRGPASIDEFVWRVAVYILVVTACSALILVINMLIGIVTKNLLVVTAVSMTYIFAEWFWHLTDLVGGLSVFSPVKICYKIADPTITTSYEALFDTTVPFQTWLSAAAPYILALSIELLVALTISVYLFARMKDV